MVELLGALVVLALLDSTSFGTLLIPVWLMLAPGRPRPGRILLFLATVAGFYLLLGLALTAGATVLMDRFAAAADSTPVMVLRLVVGLGLMVLGLTIEPWTKAGKARKAQRRAAREAEHGPGRLVRWRERATAADAPASRMVALAVTAAGIEAASMLPYLAAIGLLVSSDTGTLSRVVILLGYVAVMVLPALLLLALRVGLHARIEPVLRRIESWMVRSSGETIAWVCFLLGLYLAAGAATDLGLVG